MCCAEVMYVKIINNAATHLLFLLEKGICCLDKLMVSRRFSVQTDVGWLYFAIS